MRRRWRARDVITKGVFYCRNDQSIEDVIQLIGGEQVRRLPVINDKKRLVSILSLRDVLHHASQGRSGEPAHTVASRYAQS